jgi:transposase-like protein
MGLEALLCPSCGSEDVVKHGPSAEAEQRYKCRNADGTRCTFIQQYTYRTYLAEVRQQISPTTVIEQLKKKS